MEGIESKAESQGGQDSQIMSETLQDELEISWKPGFQNCVKEIFNLIEEDENFSEMTPEIYNSKKSKLTKMVTELSRMYEALADQNVLLLEEDSMSTPIEAQQVESSQVAQTPQFMTSASVDVTFNSSGGGFDISTTEGLESSDSKSESPVKNDTKFKGKETKVHDPKVLLKKISALEKEQLSLKKKIQDLTDENAFLESENANVPEFKRMISEASRRMKAMVGVLEASRQQVLTLDEDNKKLKQELSSKESEVTQRLQKQFDEQEVRNLELHEKASSGLAVIAQRDEQITELNAQIGLLRIFHATEEDRWIADIESLKMELEEKCEIVYDLNHKHNDLMSCVDGLKLKVLELDVCLRT